MTDTNRDMMRTVCRLQARPGLKQNRLSWLNESLRVAQKGPIVYFVGCLPFADIVFGRQIEANLLSIPRAAVRLLNSLGIEPVILPNEVCCGLDAHLDGEEDLARSLAERNTAMLKAAGAKTILTTCSDGAWMLGQYPELGFDHGCEVMYLAEFLEGKLEGVALPPGTAIWPCSSQSQVESRKSEGDTWCRGSACCTLLRFVNTHRAEQAPPLQQAGECHGSGWLPRDARARARIDRLCDAAIDSGCQRILTLCPRCLVSLKFALRPASWVKSDIDVQDLIVFLSSLVETGVK
ncbi:MAG: (Fe-S)-binding protein [Candidatus Coatesbacteria bacterium]|nr:(Fe-S)-binding protein [Candidatus Coatesbacteria bacterium]